MLLIIRPMNESTISSEDMSMSTPRAFAETMRPVEVVLQLQGQLVVHVTWMVTSRNEPIFRNRDPVHGRLSPKRLRQR